MKSWSVFILPALASVIVAKLLELFVQIYVTHIYTADLFVGLFSNAVIFLTVITVIVSYILVNRRNSQRMRYLIYFSTVIVFAIKEIYNAFVISPSLIHLLPVNLFYGTITAIISTGIVVSIINKRKLL